MARAKRHFLPGHAWHLTHRCHKKEFLLKLVKDRQRWLYWLFQAKKRYGLRILNYMVTSNHVHLLIVDGGERDIIPRSMQLIAGRTGQEYNQRKNRNGAFWEDRYHATAVQTNEHLIKCITYIDLSVTFLRFQFLAKIRCVCRAKYQSIFHIPSLHCGSHRDILWPQNFFG